MARRCNDAHRNSQIQLQQELYEANRALRTAYEKFNYVSEPELVDACVYEISALKARCNYLLRVIKERSPQSTAIRQTKKPDKNRSSRTAGEADGPCAVPCSAGSPAAAPAPRLVSPFHTLPLLLAPKPPLPFLRPLRPWMEQDRLELSKSYTGTLACRNRHGLRRI